MKTLRFKLTPHAHAETSHLEVVWYSCPDIKGDPLKTLAHVIKIAKQRHVAFDYELATELEYYAVRGARAWLFTDPDDLMATEAFKSALVRGGAFKTCAEIIGIVTTGADDHKVQVITETTCTTIDTRTGEIRTQDHVPKGWERIESDPA